MSKNIDDSYWLTKISNSKYFTSNNDVKLLRYLVSSTREGKNLKETVIAIDVFGRDASFDPGSDSIVRSNIYNLRKKLNSYYLDEGLKDSIRFIIPKGSYQVQFEQVKTEPQEKINLTKKRSFFIINILFPVSIGLMVLFAILYFSKNNGNKQQTTNQNPIWNYYQDSKNPLIIVLGDYFMMQKTQIPNNNFNYIRDPGINNQSDFLTYLNNNPDQKSSLKKLGQSYFGEEIPNCFFQLLQLLQNRQYPITMKYASELSLNDVRGNDLIFIGDFGTLGILTPFFNKSGIRFKNLPPTLYLLNNSRDTTEFISLDNPDQSVFQNDYAVVSNIASYEGRKILFLLSFLPFGKSEALYKLSEPSFLKEITDSVSIFPDNWNLLMKVSGLQSTGFYYEILKFSDLKSQSTN